MLIENYKVTFNEIDEIWEQRFVKLSDLTFVKDQMKLFYFDSEEARKKALTEVQEFSGYIKSETTKSKVGILIHQESIDSREKLDYNIINELSASLSKVNRRISEVEEKLKNNKFVIDKIIESTNNIYLWLLDEETFKCDLLI